MKGTPRRYVTGHHLRGRILGPRKQPTVRELTRCPDPFTIQTRLAFAHERVRHAVRLMQAHPGDIAYARALDARRAERDAILRMIRLQRAS